MIIIMTIAIGDKFIAIISLVALRGQIMTVNSHPSLCRKYSKWVILFDNLPTSPPKNITCSIIIELGILYQPLHHFNMVLTGVVRIHIHN